MTARPDFPIGFAHRGARAERPDNTLSGFRRARELGATGMESDAWLTADGVVVLDHDGVVRRGWRRLPIARLARRDLPAHIPTLEDLYAEVGRDVDISLDVKAAAAAETMIAVGRRHGDLRRLWLCSPDPGLLRRWRALDSTVRLVLSTRRGRGGIHPPPRQVAALGADAVNLRAQEWTAELVGACHDVGLAAFGWDAQNQATLAQVLALGVDGVYSDHVARMTAALRELRASRR